MHESLLRVATLPHNSTLPSRDDWLDQDFCVCTTVLSVAGCVGLLRSQRAKYFQRRREVESQFDIYCKQHKIKNTYEDRRSFVVGAPVDWASLLAWSLWLFWGPKVNNVCPSSWQIFGISKKWFPSLRSVPEDPGLPLYFLGWWHSGTVFPTPWHCPHSMWVAPVTALYASHLETLTDTPRSELCQSPGCHRSQSRWRSLSTQTYSSLPLLERLWAISRPWFLYINKT